MNRVFYATEEVGAISEEISTQYSFETHAIARVRNRLAHAYGEVNRDIIWAVIESEFDELLSA